MAELSTREAEVYDRQIRLWGLAAQQRMQRSKILIIGVNALNCEAAKNLVLAGIAVLLLDSRPVRGRDLGANFFFRAEDVGSQRSAAALDRMRELNPLVTVEKVEGAVDVVQRAWLEAQGVNVVLMGLEDHASQERVAAECRKASQDIAFYCGRCMGLDGFFVADLGASFTFQKEGAKDAPPSFDTLSFPTLPEVHAAGFQALRSRRFKQCVPKAWLRDAALAKLSATGVPPLPENAQQLMDAAAAIAAARGESLDALPGCSALADWEDAFRVADAEVSAVTAVVGGMLAQEVLKVLSGKGRPVANVFFFEGATGEGREARLPPEEAPPAPPAPAQDDADIIEL